MRRLAIAAVLLLAACGGDDDADNSGDTGNATATATATADQISGVDAGPTGSAVAPVTTLDGQPDCPSGEAEVIAGADIPADAQGAPSPIDAAQLQMADLGRTEELVPTDDTTFAVVVDGREVLVIETTSLENGTWFATAYLQC